MGEVTDATIASSSDPLVRATEDAHYMLAYFSRARVNIPHDKQAAFERAVQILSSFRSPGSEPSEAARTASNSQTADDAQADDGSYTSASPGDGNQADDAATPTTRAGQPGQSVTDNAVAEFWRAFILLSDLAHPATVESIRFYFRSYYSSSGQGYLAKRPDKNRWLPRSMGNQFAVLTFIALFLTIGLYQPAVTATHVGDSQIG